MKILSQATFVNPALGTPASGVVTNLTGTGAGMTAGNVTTNADLTGPVTSVGNATAIANGAITDAMLANAAVANLSGTNTGDDAANSNYLGDYRAGNFVAGTDYLGPAGDGSGLTGTAAGLTAGNVTTNADLTGGVTSVGNAATVVTNADLTGPVTSVGNATAIANGAILNVMLENADVANLIGANTGDNSANTTYADDYRVGNFVAGTDYLAPDGSAAALTSFPTLNQNTIGSAATLTTPRAINGMDFDGSEGITVTAAGNTLTGTVVGSATSTSLSLDSQKVVGARGAAVAAVAGATAGTATGGGYGFTSAAEMDDFVATMADMKAQLNTLMERFRVTGGHGLIED